MTPPPHEVEGGTRDPGKVEENLQVGGSLLTDYNTVGGTPPPARKTHRGWCGGQSKRCPRAGDAEGILLAGEGVTLLTGGGAG